VIGENEPMPAKKKTETATLQSGITNTAQNEPANRPKIPELTPVARMGIINDGINAEFKYENLLNGF